MSNSANPSKATLATSGEQSVAACRAVQMIVAGATTRKSSEEILEAAIVEEAVQIETCHYSNLLLRGLTNYKRPPRLLGIVK